MRLFDGGRGSSLFGAAFRNRYQCKILILAFLSKT